MFVTGKLYCDFEFFLEGVSYYNNCNFNCGKVINHKKATGRPEISSAKKGAGKNFQVTCFFYEDH